MRTLRRGDSRDLQDSDVDPDRVVYCTLFYYEERNIQQARQ